MNNSSEFLNRQRLAWAVLIASFFICLVITVLVPVSVNAFIQNASQDLLMAVQSNQGTVGIDDESGTRRAVIIGETAEDVGPNASILTDATAKALMLISAPEDETLLARLSIDGNSTVRIDQARAPRFNLSSEEQYVELQMESGRLRLSLLEFETRPSVFQFETPQGTIVVQDPGQYSIEVTNEATQVAVHDGMAEIAAQDSILSLESSQRAEIPTGQTPYGPLDPERSIIQNGNFEQGFDHWSEYTWKVELPEQPNGRTEIVEVEGEPTLRFERVGIGHADARVQQSINQNVSDYETIRLAVTLRILNQSLGVCGIQGSECPLFIRINYVDQNGVNQIWQHGFYAAGEIDDNNTPGACISCAVLQSNHERIPLAQDFYFEVDLLEEIARQGGLPPSFIESVSLVASGHSFETEIVDVAFIVE